MKLRVGPLRPALLCLALALVLSDLPVETVVANLTFVLLVLSRVLPAVSATMGSLNKLVKSEPFKYSWDTFVREGRTYWDGVRNFQARNNLRSMRTGDLVLFYHSNEGKEVVGVAEVAKEAYQDPTTDDDRWVVVDLVPHKTLRKPVSLASIKQHPKLAKMALIKQSRLSVLPVTAAEFRTILSLSD